MSFCLTTGSYFNISLEILGCTRAFFENEFSNATRLHKNSSAKVVQTWQISKRFADYVLLYLLFLLILN